MKPDIFWLTEIVPICFLSETSHLLSKNNYLLSVFCLKQVVCLLSFQKIANFLYETSCFDGATAAYFREDELQGCTEAQWETKLAYFELWLTQSCSDESFKTKQAQKWDQNKTPLTLTVYASARLKLRPSPSVYRRHHTPVSWSDTLTLNPAGSREKSRWQGGYLHIWIYITERRHSC